MSLILVVVALVLFLLATFNVPAKINLTALGLAFYMMSLLVGNVGLN